MNINEVVVKNLTPTIIPFNKEKPDVTLLMMKSASVGLMPDGTIIKDLGGDYFKPTTDWGDQRVKTVRLFLDHAHNSETNEYMFPAKQLIGAAHVVPKDDAFKDWLNSMGLSEDEILHRWYLCEVEKSNAYHNYVMALNSMKILGCSTQAYLGGVDRQKDGGIDRWWENEVTFTVCPMDYKTVGQIYELAKSFNLPVFNKKDFIMSQEAKPNTEVVVEETPVVEAAVTPTEVASEETAATPEPTLEAQIDNLIGGEGEDSEETVAVPVKFLREIQATQKELKDMYTSISAHMDMYANLSELPELIRTLQAVVGAAEQEGTIKHSLAAILTSVNDTKRGVSKFADHVVKKLQVSGVAGAPGETDLERQARDVAKNTVISGNAGINFPPNAPGA